MSTDPVFSEVQKINPSAIIELFTLQLDNALHGATTIYRFHAGSNLNANGEIVWARSWGSSQIDRSNNIIIDANGNSYVTGYTRGGFNGMVSSGGADALIIKFDPNGEILWQKQFGGSSDDWANSVVVTNSGELFISGDTHGDRGEELNDRNIFLAKFNPETGEQLWIKEYGTESFDSGKLIYDHRTDRKMLIGSTSGDLITGLPAGDQDLKKGFIMELDEQYNVRSIAQSQATNGDVHFLDFAKKVAILKPIVPNPINKIL